MSAIQKYIQFNPSCVERHKALVCFLGTSKLLHGQVYIENNTGYVIVEYDPEFMLEFGRGKFDTEVDSIEYYYNHLCITQERFGRKRTFSIMMHDD